MYKSPNSDLYIVFGETKVEDTSAANSFTSSGKFQEAAALAAAAAAANKAGKGVPAAAAAAAAASAPAKVEAAGSAAAADDEVVDETGLEAKDIELVIQQANVSRARAVKALRNSNNDIVNAIMVRKKTGCLLFTHPSHLSNRSSPCKTLF